MRFLLLALVLSSWLLKWKASETRGAYLVEIKKERGCRISENNIRYFNYRMKSASQRAELHRFRSRASPTWTECHNGFSGDECRVTWYTQWVCGAHATTGQAILGNQPATVVGTLNTNWAGRN